MTKRVIAEPIKAIRLHLLPFWAAERTGSSDQLSTRNTGIGQKAIDDHSIR